MVSAALATLACWSWMALAHTAASSSHLNCWTCFGASLIALVYVPPWLQYRATRYCAYLAAATTLGSDDASDSANDTVPGAPTVVLSPNLYGSVGALLATHLPVLVS